MRTLYRRFLTDRSGAVAVEYTLVVAVVSVAAITAMDAIGATLIDMINQISATIQDVIARIAQG